MITHVQRASSRGDDDTQQQVSHCKVAFDSTENIVFANVSALVPLLFTKNPDAEFTCEDKEDRTESARMSRNSSTYSQLRRQHPVLNLKRKVKRNIVSTALM